MKYQNNLENNKKIAALEKRIEFLLESDLNLISMGPEKLRKNLTDLMKENENNKRENEAKNREIGRLNEKINNLNYRLARMSLKFENMKNEKSHTEGATFIGTLNREDNDQNENSIINSITSIPKSLDFRVNSLKIEYASKTIKKIKYFIHSP